MIVRLFALHTHRLSSVLRETLLGSGNHRSVLQVAKYTVHSFNKYLFHVFIILITVCAVTLQLSGRRICSDIAQGKYNQRQ